MSRSSSTRVENSRISHRQKVNHSNKDREDRVKFLGYIAPIITDYAENNRIDPAVCYEVCHELELMMIEKCKVKGMNTYELEKHKQTSFKEAKELLKRG
jgi:hypothetical protein